MSAPAVLSADPAAAESGPLSAATSTPPDAARLRLLRHPLGVVVLILAIVVGIYSPALEGQYLWDDYFLVKNAPLIRSPIFGLEVFRHTLFDDTSTFYRPAQALTYIADYWFWGLDPYGYHLSNTLIQAANGILLFLLLRRLLPALLPPPANPPTTAGRRAATDWVTVVLALLWVVHPVHSAAVAYISGRADSLAMLFCVSAWLLCERALDSARPLARVAWWFVAAACLLLGLCSKEIAFVWLLLFCLWLFILRPRPTGRARFGAVRIGIAAGGLCMLGAYVSLRHLPNLPASLGQAPPVSNRWLLVLRALGDYGSLMLYPDRLFMERQVFASTDDGGDPNVDELFFLSLSMAGAVMLAAFAVGAFWPGRGRLLRRCGAVWFLIGFIPVSNIFALNATVAEHWLYLPSVGFLLFLTGVIADLRWRGTELTSLRSFQQIAGTVAVLAVGALGARTWFRAHDWVDALTFYKQTIRDGGNVPRARQGLASAYREKDDSANAIAILRDIAKRYPRVIGARVNLGSALIRQGKTDEAREVLEKIAADVIAAGRQHTEAREYAIIIRGLDRVEPPDDPKWAGQRQTLVETALARFPNVWELADLNLHDHLVSHDTAGAQAIAQRFHDAHWWHAPSLIAVARLQGQAGQIDAALEACHQAARLDVHDTDAPDTAAILCAEHGRNNEAVALLHDAVRRQPNSMRQRLLLAEVLERAGRHEEAAREKERAAQMSEAAADDQAPL